jgi:hypothetical protein
LDKLGIPELTSEQIVELCKVAEERTRKYVASRVPQKQIEKLDVTTEVEGLKPVSIVIDVDVRLSPIMKDIDVKKLADDAAASGLIAAEEFLRELVCQPWK